MTCEKCGTKQATTYIKTLIGGEVTERHLCGECAQGLGYGNIFGNFGLSLNQFVGSFITAGENTSALATQNRCECSGASFGDIAGSGKVGCADCYRKFYVRLLPLIQRIHGNTSHSGKKPARLFSPLDAVKTQLTQKKEQLKQAVAAQNFENAAVLRDEIRELEKGLKDNA